MAESKKAEPKKESKIVLEREYTIPLRRKFVSIPRYQRTKKSVRTVREFIEKHMKTQTVRIGRALNVLLWKHGWKNALPRVSVVAKKDDAGIVDVDLKGAAAAAKPVEKKATEAKASAASPAVKDAEVVSTSKADAKGAAPKAEAAKPAKPKADATKAASKSA